MKNTTPSSNESYSTPQRRRRQQQPQRHGERHHQNNHNDTMISSSSSSYSSPSLISSDDGSCSTVPTTVSSTRSSVKTSRTSKNNTTIISIHVEYKCCSHNDDVIKKDQKHQKHQKHQNQQQVMEEELIDHVMDLSKEIVRQKDSDEPQQELHCASPDYSAYSNNAYVDDEDDDDNVSFATALSATSIDSEFGAMCEEQKETAPVHPREDHSDASVTKSVSASTDYEDDLIDSYLCADHRQQHDASYIKDASSFKDSNNSLHHHQKQHSQGDDSTRTSDQTNHDDDAVTMKAALEESFFQVSQAETVAGEMQDTIQELSQQTLMKWWTDVTADEKMPTNIGIPDFVATAITSLQNLQQQLFNTTHCDESTTNIGPTMNTYSDEDSSSSLSILLNKDDTKESARTSSRRFGQLDGNHKREWLETFIEEDEIHESDCDDIIRKNNKTQQGKCCTAVAAVPSGARRSVSTATSSSDVMSTAAKNCHHDHKIKPMNDLDHAEMNKNLLTTHLAAQIQTSSVEMICYETDQMASIVQQLAKQQQDVQDMLDSCGIQKENEEATINVTTTVNEKNLSSIKMEPSIKASKNQTTRITSPPLILRQRRQVSGTNTFRRFRRSFLTRLVVVVLAIISSSALAFFTMHKSEIDVIVYKQGVQMAVHRRKGDVMSFADDKIQAGAILAKQAVQKLYKNYGICINLYSSSAVTKTSQIILKLVLESRNKWNLFLRTHVHSVIFVDEVRQVIDKMNVKISRVYQGALPDVSSSIVKKAYYKHLRTFIIEMVDKWNQVIVTFIISYSKMSIGEALSVTNKFFMDVFHICQSIFPHISIEEVNVALLRRSIKESFDLRESWYQSYQKVTTLPEIMCFGKVVKEMKKMIFHSSRIHEQVLRGVTTKLPHFSTSDFLSAFKDTYQTVEQNLAVAMEGKIHQISLIPRFYPLISANDPQVLIARQNLFVDKLHRTLEILMDRGQFVNCYHNIFDFYQKYVVIVASAKTTTMSRDRDISMYLSDLRFLGSWDYHEENDSIVPLL